MVASVDRSLRFAGLNVRELRHLRPQMQIPAPVIQQEMTGHCWATYPHLRM